jgi:hypothetical protein
MAKQLINIGNIINDGAGDTLREGAIKVNNTLNELYSSLGDGNNLIVVLDPTSSPTDGQVLQWNNDLKKFQFGEAGARGFTGPQGPEGPQGPQGPQGDLGPQGPQGDIGPRLSVKGSVTSVEDLPDSNNESGDIFIVTGTGDSYVWQETPDGDSSFGWINIGPLQGPQGDPGPQGLQGPQGDPGPQGIAGLSVIGAVTLVEDLPEFNNLQGDFWIVTSTGDGYIWSPSEGGDSGFEWVNVGPWQGSPTAIEWQITSSGSSAYVFAGPGIVSGNTDNPELYLYKGFTYRFVNNVGGAHPFEFRVSNGGAEYTSGISGSKTGTQTFTVPMNAPSTLYYQCTIHSVMGNIIYIV